MAGLLSKVTRFARGPQGRKLANRAQTYAKSAEGKRKIEQVRGQLARRSGKRP